MVRQAAAAHLKSGKEAKDGAAAGGGEGGGESVMDAKVSFGDADSSVANAPYLAIPAPVNAAAPVLVLLDPLAATSGSALAKGRVFFYVPLHFTRILLTV